MRKIKVIPYQLSWPEKYKVESTKIKEALGSHVLSIHHIGSTSIEGLAAKEDIDILLVVDQLHNSLKLQEIGYTYKGELNVPLRYFFSKNTEYSKVNLHVTEAHHGFITLNLTFRDYLRSHYSARIAYQELKYEILKDPKNHKKLPSGHLTRYGTRKDKFIKEVLKKAGFEDYCINFCHHRSEWRAYENLLGSVDSKEKKSPLLVYFILYQGTEVVAALKASKEGEILSIKSTEPKHLDELKKWYRKWNELSKSS